MAKVKSSLVEFQGTIQNLTFVRSKAYKEHVRMKRGTYTPVEINDALKQSAKVLVKANGYAKIIKDAFEPYRVGSKDGTAWSRLVSLFKKTLAAGKPMDYTFLKGFEFHSKHSLHRIALLNLVAVKDSKKNVLNLSCSGVVRFPERLGMNAYMLKIIVAFPLANKKTTIVACEEFPAQQPGKECNHEMVIDLPKKFDAIVIGIKVTGYKRGSSSFNAQANGLGIVGVI